MECYHGLAQIMLTNNLAQVVSFMIHFKINTCAFLKEARKAVAVSLTSFVSSVTSLDLLGIGDSISILTPSACRAKASEVRFFTHFVLVSLLLSFSVGKFAAKTTRTP